MQGELPLEREILSKKDRYNEYVMTRLRTAAGISIQQVSEQFGAHFKTYMLQQAQPHIDSGLLQYNNFGRRVSIVEDLANTTQLVVTKEGKFLSDGIASDLFWIELQG